jgi:MFS family permease
VSTAADDRPEQVQRRTVRTLVGSQVLGGVGVASGLAVGGLLAKDISGSTALSGLALTMSVLGAALAALPMSRLMIRSGRRPGLVAGYVAGVVGAVLVVVASVLEWFPLVLVGSTLFGASTAANLQARYAATDLAAPQHRGRALSTVVWATTIGAVLGPNFTGPGAKVAEWLGLPDLAGPYVFSLVAFAAAAALLAVTLRPDPLLESRRVLGTVVTESRHSSLRAGLEAIRRSPQAVLGLAAVALAQTTMVSVMVMTPVHMRDGGVELNIVGFVISVHIAGMYALAPVAGWLSDRVGRVSVIIIGQVFLLLAVLFAGNAGVHDTSSLGVGLFLLGLGWSCALVAGSTLLAESVQVAARPLAQGAADFVMNICGAVGGAVAGVALDLVGYGGLNALAALLVVPVVVLVLTVPRVPSAPSAAAS